MQTATLEPPNSQTQILRPYQVECVNAVMGAKNSGLLRVMYTMATGTGKTTTFAELIRRLYDGRPAIVIAHREELLSQAARRIADHTGLYVGVERADQRASRDSQVVVASVQTIGRKGSNRLDWIKSPALIIVDEMHHTIKGSQHHLVLERFGSYESTFTVGCTATPKRLDRMALLGMPGAIWEQEVFRYGIRQAIQEGYLCDIRGFRVETKTDLTKIKSTGGDYNLKELDQAVNNERRTLQAIEKWLEVARNRKTIAFCASIEHSKNTAKAFRAAGLAAEHLDGSMHMEDRRAVLHRLKTGETQLVSNMGVLTEGFDEPSVSCVLMMRPTQSWSLYCQCVGRGTRIYPGKPDLVVIDLCDLTRKHSLATVPTIIDLPANLDLEGNSLEEAAKKMEEVGENINKRADVPRLTFDDLDALLREVDMLAQVDTPPDVQELSLYPWIREPGGGYYLDCGNAGAAMLRQSATSKLYYLHLMGPGGVIIEDVRAFTDNLADAFKKADFLIDFQFPTAKALRRSAAWRKNAPSPKQIALLKRFHYSDAFLSTISAGQAGMLITAKIGKNRVKNASTLR